MFIPCCLINDFNELDGSLLRTLWGKLLSYSFKNPQLVECHILSH